MATKIPRSFLWVATDRYGREQKIVIRDTQNTETVSSALDRVYPHDRYTNVRWLGELVSVRYGPDGRVLGYALTDAVTKAREPFKER